MKLFYSPGACSLGIHIILEEIGALYGLELVNLRDGAQFSPEFRTVNPKGKVPVLLRDDGTVLTEFPAIAFWLARMHPQAGLLADAPEGQARALELVDFVVATVHMRGFTLMGMPQKLVSDPAAQAELRAAGQRIFTDGLATLSENLGEEDWFLGHYSIVDAAVFYVLNWAAEVAFPVPDNLAAFRARMIERPAVRRALQQEGLADHRDGRA